MLRKIILSEGSVIKNFVERSACPFVCGQVQLQQSKRHIKTSPKIQAKGTVYAAHQVDYCTVNLK